MQDKNPKIVNCRKNNVKRTMPRARKNIRDKTPVNSANSSEDGVSLKEAGDLIYELLSGGLSAVANEIIAEIELSEDD
ncbi:hypothetical protein ACFL2E_05465 [Thermodesulfobacteriota bacterium]